MVSNIVKVVLIIVNGLLRYYKSNDGFAESDEQFLIRFQSSSGSTPVFSEKYWSPFREGLESFPQGTGIVSARLSRYFPGNGPGSAETNRKKSSWFIPLIDSRFAIWS